MINETEWISFIPSEDGEEFTDIVFKGKHHTDSGYTVEKMSLKDILPEDTSVDDFITLCSIMR